MKPQSDLNRRVLRVHDNNPIRPLARSGAPLSMWSSIRLPSEGQLEYARKRPSTAIVQFRQGESQALPHADESFDAVAMALVITFIPDAAKAIADRAP